ncbi:LacI family DNA-binding transcriptional regulator [Actinoplanes sp. N902-109]|uniref:LacI family DNA-binding transcriptional regulator n=1 Tax=Actinoplanes sp. (strain N902-109) TaxID=649831 RepID=UPI0003293B7F|nr:LacI family DNA-binding transcriptional regulator [Actinoplanes sp. N902-109]AGL14323.1 LacI family transcriptional regulator [Actinoplanes sp. N902-109]
MGNRPTIADIAKRVGVSPGAVSFALNGRPGVSEQTRARILEAAREMNWRPHRAARALGGSQAGVVGLVLARDPRTLGSEQFYTQLLYGMQDALSARSFAVQMQLVRDTAAEIALYRDWASEHRVDGLVLVDLQVDDPRVAVLDELRLPAVTLGPRHERGLPSVEADDGQAMITIVDYLATLGHRHIAHVAGPPIYRHTARRMTALREHAVSRGLDVGESVSTDFSDAQGAAATRTLLSRHRRPSAIIYDSDLMAAAGLGVALELGVRVPQELSIVSFDDSVLTRIVHPQLTCLSRDTYALGAQVAECLLATIADPGAPHSVQSETPRLVVRGSTARAVG